MTTLPLCLMVVKFSLAYLLSTISLVLSPGSHPVLVGLSLIRAPASPMLTYSLVVSLLLLLTL